jgi:hypothetical protein
MLEFHSIVALADLAGDLLMVGLAVVFFALMWATIELLERV